jgi:hypothetical protein
LATIISAFFFLPSRPHSRAAFLLFGLKPLATILAPPQGARLCPGLQRKSSASKLLALSKIRARLNCDITYRTYHRMRRLRRRSSGAHWEIENSLGRASDVVYCEDDSQIRYFSKTIIAGLDQKCTDVCWFDLCGLTILQNNFL